MNFFSELASLSELVEVFSTRIKLAWLPSGTIVLFGAAGYLAAMGTSAYADEYVESRLRLKQQLPQNSYVSHAPVLLTAGTEDPALIRSLSKLGQWLLIMATESENQVLPETTAAWSSLLTAKPEDPQQQLYGTRLELPNPQTLRETAKHGIPNLQPLSSATAAP